MAQAKPWAKPWTECAEAVLVAVADRAGVGDVLPSSACAHRIGGAATARSQMGVFPAAFDP